MTYLLQPEHLAHLYLGLFGPALLLALLAVHFATRTSPAHAIAAWWHDPEADALAAAVEAVDGEHVGVQDDAATTAWLGDLHDDVEPEPEDVFSLTLAAREEEIEAALDWVHDLEARLALETATTFGFIYLAGAPR